MKSNPIYLFVQTAAGPFVGQRILAVQLSKDSFSLKLTPKEESDNKYERDNISKNYQLFPKLHLLVFYILITEYIIWAKFMQF